MVPLTRPTHKRVVGRGPRTHTHVPRSAGASIKPFGMATRHSTSPAKSARPRGGARCAVRGARCVPRAAIARTTLALIANWAGSRSRRRRARRRRRRRRRPAEAGLAAGDARAQAVVDGVLHLLHFHQQPLGLLLLAAAQVVVDERNVPG